MAFTKITNQELNSRGATTLPNQPKISATALKQEFDAPAKNIVAPKFNNLIDELEATTAAASLGAVAPTGRTGETVQAVIDDISDDLATLEAGVGPAIEDAHTHANKDLLDTYTQTESDLANAVSNAHTHSNKTVIDKFSDVSGVPYYNGAPIAGSGEMAIDGSNAASHVNFSGAFTVGARSSGTIGTNSTCEGRQNVASGDCAHAEGRACDATGENAHAEGCGTEATNEYAHAEGLNSVASGGASHAEGYNTTASLGPSHAEGNSTTASGLASHAEGDSTTASGRNSHSEGEHTTASGDYSHAEGSYSTASGDCSHASGNHTTAAYANQTSIGKYNTNYSHHLFAIGNGTDSIHTKNVFEVWNTGDVSFDDGTTRFRMRRIRETVTLSTSADTDVTFTDADYIDSNAVLSVYTDVFGMNPINMSVSNHTCTVTFPKVDTAATINVILEISGTMSQVI